MIRLTELLPQKHNFTIYCDMDNTIVDFIKNFKLLSNGIEPDVYETKYGEDAFWDLINAAGLEFWSNMPWLPDGKKLWNFIKSNAIILSAPSSHSTVCKQGKHIWVNRELGSNVKVILEKDKYKYATPTSILIDDLPKNIEKWKAAGGIGILHTSANTTINMLKEILA